MHRRHVIVAIVPKRQRWVITATTAIMPQHRRWSTPTRKRKLQRCTTLGITLQLRCLLLFMAGKSS
jgi:hypothetical protein